MPASVPVACPHCGHVGKLKNPAALGTVKPCPACGERFRLEPARGGRVPHGGGGLPGWVKVAGGVVAAAAVLLCAGVFYVAFDQAKEKRERADARAVVNRAAAQQPPPPVAPVEDEGAARELGEAFIAAAEAGDRAAVARLIDLDALLDAATTGMEIPPDDRRQFAAGFSGTADGMAEQYVAAGQSGGLRLLGDDGAPGVDGPPGALIRLINEGGGLNYLILYPTPDGRIGDMYVFASGERFSATLRRLLGPLLAGTRAEKEGAARLGEMNAAVQRGDAAAAERLYQTLPESLKANRGVQVIRAIGAAGGDPDAYAAVLADVDRRFPNDPSLDLLKIDAYAEDLDRLIPTLERLDAALGGDPHLRGLLAEYLPDAGRADDALKIARAAVAEEPDLAQAQFGMLSALIAVGDHAAAAETLRTLRDEFGLAFEPADLAELYPEGQAFLDSPEYAAFAGEG